MAFMMHARASAPLALYSASNADVKNYAQQDCDQGEASACDALPENCGSVVNATDQSVAIPCRHSSMEVDSLHRNISTMSSRIRQLEHALEISRAQQATTSGHQRSTSNSSPSSYDSHAQLDMGDSFFNPSGYPSAVCQVRWTWLTWLTLV